MLYMGRAFRNLVGVTVTSTHHNALGATSAARLRFELFWQVVVVLAIEDLIKGAFCENVQWAILSLLFFRRYWPLRYHAFGLEGALFSLLYGFVDLDVHLTPEFFTLAARYWYLTPQLGLRFSSKRDPINKTLTTFSLFLVAKFCSKIVIYSFLRHKWVISLRIFLLQRLLKVSIGLIPVLNQVISISFNIDFSRAKIESLLTLAIFTIFFLAIGHTLDAGEVLVLYDHRWVSHRYFCLHFQLSLGF